MTVDAELMDEGLASVSAGGAENLSAWVNDALRLKAAHDRRMRALDEFIGAYETEHGTISEDEIDDARRWARARAVVVRGMPGAGSPRQAGTHS